MGKIYEGLIKDYREGIKPLSEQERGLQKKLSKIQSEREIEQFSAKLKVLDNEIVSHIADGAFEKADTKKREKAEIESHILALKESRSSRVNEMTIQIDELHRKQNSVKNDVFRAAFPKIITDCHHKFEDAIDNLEEVSSDIKKFQRETGADIPHSYIYRLEINNYGETKKLWRKLSKWIMGM